MAEPAAAPDGVRGHRRFALRDVTLSGVAVSGATVDVWRDGMGATRWLARLLMPVPITVVEGLLRGTAANGQPLCGVVRVGEVHAGPRRAREVLVELHGQGELSEDNRDPADVPPVGPLPASQPVVTRRATA